MIRKIIGYLRGLLRARSLENFKPFRLEGRLILYREHGTLEIGDRTLVWPDVKISIVGKPDAPARVRIGSRCTVGDRTQIHACRLVEIGNRVRISWDVTILENNYHMDSSGPVRIEDDVWIGCHVVILSGVTIGRGAVVGAGSVVTKDIPPHAMAGGNPARVVRELTPEYREQHGMDRLP